MSLSGEPDAPGARAPLPGDDLREGPLPVAVHTRDAQDLAPTHA